MTQTTDGDASEEQTAAIETTDISATFEFEIGVPADTDKRTVENVVSEHAREQYGIHVSTVSVSEQPLGSLFDDDTDHYEAVVVGNGQPMNTQCEFERTVGGDN